MIYYNPPHEVTSKEKLAAMIDFLNGGGELPPIVVMGYDAYTGSHRIAAYRAVELERQIPTVEMSDADYCAAMCEIGKEPGDEIYDYDEFCEALYNVTESAELKEALADQFA